MEAFAVDSHERAIRATAEGRFEREIVPVKGLAHDEGPREPNWEKIRSLPTLREGGRITAAVASQISDASAAHAHRRASGARRTTASRRGRASTTCRCGARIR